MGDDHRNPAAFLHAGYGAGKGLLAVSIEIGVGFIEDYQGKARGRAPGRARCAVLWPAERAVP